MKTDRIHRKYALSARFTALLVAILTASAFVYLAWSWYLQNEMVHDKALAEARTLKTEILASWDYVDTVQNSINYNNDGSYDFKGVYCSVAGKRIAQRFTKNSSGYVIRFVRDNPRTPTDAPDAFEAEALAAFSHEGALEFYDMADFNGQRVFRYLNVLQIRPGCLSCHGDPAGEKDVTGYIKEGMQLDDVGGAVSIVIPLDMYDSQAQTRTTQTVLFFLVLMVVVVLIARSALKRWVTDSLIESKERLEGENEAKSNYLASMSHEMRTPLTSIIAFTEIWEKNADKDDFDEKGMVKEIKDNSMVLLEMVNNTIDVARLEAGHFEVQCDELDMVDVVNTVIGTVMPLARKKGITLNKYVDSNVPILMGDWDALRKILVNLVSNALKYTDEKGEVSIEVSFDAGKDLLSIAVSDNGNGIAKEDMDRIFDKYVQVGKRLPAGSTGSGLGLFLVKTLVEELRGSVTIESELGEGSTFKVVIPAKACN